MANKYEAMLVFTVKDGAEKAEELTEKFKALIEANGTVESCENWGGDSRKLAYPINYETEGRYVLITFTAEPEFPAELDRVLKITDGVLRSLIIKK